MSLDTTTGRKRKIRIRPDAPGAKALASIGNDLKASAELSDFYLWGTAAIGAEINRTEKQVFHLHYSGALKGAVRKVNGHLVGSRHKLRELLGG